MDEVFDYRCYHCKQVFRGALAEAHFGTTPDAMARCIAMTSRDSFGDPHAPFVPFKMFKHEVERRESAEAALRIASEIRTIKPTAETLWVIYFEDAEIRPEMFFGPGAEEGARRRYKEALTNWSCHLCVRVPDGQ